MTKKKDQNLTLSEALTIAWKARKDYKGYDRSKGSSFNSWRSITNTEKGRDIGFPDTWREYDSFMADVKGEWSVGKIVRRLDTKKPHSADNSFWDEKGLENTGRLVQLEYNGETKTLLEWSAELALNYQGVRQRYFKGKSLSPKEILFGKEKKLRPTKDRTLAFRTARMLGAYRLRDKRRGVHNDLTLEFFREEIKKGCVYCGDMENVGLDRVDNTRGHEVTNVVPCCYVCNCARMDNFSFDEMKVIGLAIKEVKRLRNETN